MSDKRGRRPKGDGPAFPHDEVDQLLVHGAEVDRSDGKGTEVRYPSYREVAERYGVAHSLIARFARARGCLKRRQQAKKRVQEMADVKLSDLRADALALSRDDAVRTIDRYLARFEEALAEGIVRCDNPTDFNTMVRLKAFLLGDAESRHEVLGGLTLEDLQERHQQMLRQWEESTPEIRGEAAPIPCSMEELDREEPGGLKAPGDPSDDEGSETPGV